jgi:RHH-type proline utilization regulon transcriptional repressor/proline dehydrogenase/delta 1-pyrroline-5-carboxylate dehydrogenase
VPHDDAVNPTLTEYIAWLDANNLATEANIARDLGRRAALGFTTELNGPVGERNLYALHPRGGLLLMPLTAAGLYHQLGAMLATGNTATVAAAPNLELLSRALPAHIVTRIAWRTEWEADGPFAGALIEGDAERVAAINARIARLPGPLVPVQAASSKDLATDLDAYCIDRLLEEVSTSINTTAAGGNASLMALS